MENNDDDNDDDLIMQNHYFLWEYYFWYRPFWFIPIFSGMQLGCKAKAGCRILVRKLHGQRIHGDTNRDKRNNMMVEWSWDLDGTDSGQDMVTGLNEYSTG
jgi:hypothetical protein